MPNYSVLDLSGCEDLPSFFSEVDFCFLCVPGAYGKDFDIVIDSMPPAFIAAHRKWMKERAGGVSIGRGACFIDFTLPIGFFISSLPVGFKITPITPENKKQYLGFIISRTQEDNVKTATRY